MMRGPTRLVPTLWTLATLSAGIPAARAEDEPEHWAFIAPSRPEVPEVADGLEADYPAGLRGLVRFPSGDARALRERIEGVLALAPAEREAIRAAARVAAVERWSWSSVAQRILDVAA